MTTETSPVWFITGCTSGFGHEVAKQVIATGARAVITARDKARLADLADGCEETVLAVDLDVTKQDQVEAAAKAAVERFGRIDVLVNNAGYGYMSTIEEGEEAEIRAQFDANVFGLFAVTRAILPTMRRQRSGRVISITSVAGLVGFPGSGYYAASKHAVEGFSDALAAEGAPIGIQVTCIEPGPFRTDWAGRSMTQTPNKIAEYAGTAGVRLANTKTQSGKQPGNPVRAAEMILQVAAMDTAPRHMVLGAFGVGAVTSKLKSSLADVETWRELGLSADFPQGE